MERHTQRATGGEAVSRRDGRVEWEKESSKQGRLEIRPLISSEWMRMF